MHPELMDIIRLYWLSRSVAMNPPVKPLITYKPVSNQTFFKEFPK